MDAVVDAVVSKMKEERRYSLNVDRTIYAHGVKTSGMRTLLVDIAVWVWTDDPIEKLLASAGDRSEFVRDIAASLFKIRGSGRQGVAPFAVSDTRVYHDHVAEGKPCYKTLF